MIPCNSCNAMIPEGSKFCTTCGAAAPSAGGQATPAAASGNWFDAVGGHPQAPNDATVPAYGVGGDYDATVVRDPGVAAPVGAAPIGGVPVAGGPAYGAPGAGGPPVGGPPVGGLTTEPNYGGGFEGSVGGGQPKNSRNLIIGGGIAAVAIVGIGAAFFLTRGDDGGSGGGSVGFPNIPTTVEEQWEESADGFFRDFAISSDTVFTASEEEIGESEIYAFDSSTGEERWNETIEGFRWFAGVLDGVVFAYVCDDEECSVVAIEADTGDEVWDESIDDDETPNVFNGRLYLSGDNTYTQLDPETGDGLERIRADRLSIDDQGNFIARDFDDDEDDIEVFDADLESIFGPVEIDSDSGRVAYESGRLLVINDDEIDIVDDEGEVVRSSDIGEDARDIASFGRDLVLVEAGDEVFAFDISEDRAEELWSERGELHQVSPDRRAVVIVDGDEFVVIEVRSGETRFDGDREGGLRVGQNALLAPEFGSNDTTWTAYQWSDGEEIWQEDFDGEVFFGEDTILELEGEDVRVYR